MAAHRRQKGGAGAAWGRPLSRKVICLLASSYAGRQANLSIITHRGIKLAEDLSRDLGHH
jgi:hypothetical protein